MAISFSRTTRALGQDSARYSLLGLGIAGLCLIAWLIWFLRGTVQLYEVSRQARVEVGSASREVSTLQSGRLVLANLVIGQQVKSGDLLIELDSQMQKLKLAEAVTRQRGYPLKIAAVRHQIAALERSMAGDVQASAAGVRSARARIDEADANARFAGDLAVRQRAESKSGGAAPIEAVRAAADATKATAARNALAADASKLALDVRTRGSQAQAQIAALDALLISLQSELATTQQVIAELQLEIENRQVRAPVDGVIGEVLASRPGAFVSAGQKLATIVPGGDLVIVAKFDPATALGRIKAGQTAELRLDGFPWAQYGSVTARVLRVAEEMRDDGLRVELKVVRSPRSGLRLSHGMTGKVAVTVEAASPSALLLRSAGQAIQ